MGSSEIWDKYHEYYFGNGTKFHKAKLSEITHFQYNNSGIYPKFSLLYPCYSMLIPYSLTFDGVFTYVRTYVMYKLCH